jgi:putative addiction module component (TIGR02574 family)
MMTAQTSQILADALRLPENDRALIAQELLATLSPDLGDPSDDELEAELDQRLAEFQQDPSAAIEWSQLRKSTR